MAYGPDPDPYGAVPPYRIGYDTYTPNFPAIPGVANSFAPTGMISYDQGYEGGSGDATPSVAPGITSTGSMSDYNFFYGNVNAPDIRTFNPKAVGPQHLFPATDPNFQPAYTPYGGSNPLAMMGSNPAPFGSTSYTSSTSPSSNIASVGRAAPSLGPIGTRPPSNGGSTRTMPPIPGLSMHGLRGNGQWNLAVSRAEQSRMLDLKEITNKGGQDKRANEMSRER